MFENKEYLKREYRLSFSSIEEFVEIQNKILASRERIIISAEETEYIADGLMVLLGTIPELSQKNKSDVRIRFRVNSKFEEKLASSGVLQYYKGSQATALSKDKILFCCPTSLVEYLEIVKKVMKMTPVTFEEAAYSALSSKLYEVFDNAVTHGKNEIGVFSYGNIQNNKFVFSVYDLGIGIQNNVNNFVKKEYTTQQAMEWALAKGNSTKEVDYPRGAGFTLLESFVKANDGTMFLCSDDMICRIKRSGRTFHKMKHRILGTLLTITIKADWDSVYAIRRSENG